MSIELNSAPKGVKALASADPHGKKTGKAADASGGSGFSALMNLLSASEDTPVSLAAATSLVDEPLAEKGKLSLDVTAAENGAAVPIPPFVAPVQEQVLATGLAGTTAIAFLSTQVSISTHVQAPATVLAPAQVPTLTPALSPAQATSTVIPAATLASVQAPTQVQAVGKEGVVLQMPSAVPQTPAVDVPQAALMSMQATIASLGVAVGAGSNANASEVPPQLVDLALPEPTAGSGSLPVEDGKKTTLPFADSNSAPNKPGQHLTTADAGALQKSALTSTTSDALSLSAAGEQAMADVAQTSTVSALLAHKSAAQAQVIGAAQHDFKEARAAAASQLVVPAADASATLLAGTVSDFVRPQGRFGARPGFGQSGSSGFEGAFGQATAATHRSDAVFEVPPASAAVADTAVAETVSYWASQGVQTAELTLDGFGDSPVEVSILLNGDQAQIDFRTDQEGVRQVLEAATAQLKELLSSQGLALAGVSVGTSGKGNDAGGERRARPDAKQITLVKSDALGAVATRAANPAVGRSLDLFV